MEENKYRTDRKRRIRRNEALESDELYPVALIPNHQWPHNASHRRRPANGWRTSGNRKFPMFLDESANFCFFFFFNLDFVNFS